MMKTFYGTGHLGILLGTGDVLLDNHHTVLLPHRTVSVPTVLLICPILVLCIWPIRLFGKRCHKFWGIFYTKSIFFISWSTGMLKFEDLCAPVRLANISQYRVAVEHSIDRWFSPKWLREYWQLPPAIGQQKTQAQTIKGPCLL